MPETHDPQLFGVRNRLIRWNYVWPVTAGLLVFALTVLLTACIGEDEPEIDSTAAEEAYVECAEALGIEVTDVQIGRDTFDIELAPDAPDDAVEVLYRECEPLALEILEDAGEDVALPDVPEGVSSVEEYVKHLEESDFSGMIVIDRGGADEMSFSFGFADRDRMVENTVDTSFDTGSISKTFTAVAMLRLVDDGVISLDDTLADLLPSVPSDKQEITVLQLLNFTSGLRGYHDTEGDFEPMSRAQALRRILGQELLFPPGSDYAYSNSSYTLAAVVIEEVTGRNFVDVVRDLFLEADLDQTDFYGGPNLQDIDVATGYEGETHDGNNPQSWDPTWALLGGGGIVSSVTDLQTWWTAITGTSLLSSDSTEILLGEVLPTETVGGLTFRGAAGTNDFGFDAIVAEVPDQEALIIVTSNANPPDQTMATEVAAVLAQLDSH